MPDSPRQARTTGLSRGSDLRNSDCWAIAYGVELGIGRRLKVLTASVLFSSYELVDSVYSTRKKLPGVTGRRKRL